MDGTAHPRRVEELLDTLGRLESPASELGTPVLVPSAAVDELVAMGPAAVPDLLRHLEGRPAKVAAYLALVLGRIGDQRAVAPLRRLRGAYRARAPKDEWDYAVIGQCDLAIRALRTS
ncbi:hypothetical protein [Phytohabitans rumicis]|uniref:Uncharacterized protein n=1 Tax=Phytohabitans rumicis TaxID=1076125 RepID=A0A6V8LJF2_9ACTN|nr:hypothetical protein [Phytohabitans rumicis]GFJ96344.1 hypothetical protein Prum_099860 [Phytohabitans rumicis]